ncbi:MAG TPA: hypothetical protein VEF55_06775 [Candidatus Binatia bacterium]|nr:hypothetical protein [Candidatus Binatia bacterium]
MLRGWPIALVAATGASGLFAFGVLQSAFTQQAQALFIVFAAVLILFVGGKKVLGGGGGHGAHGAHAAHGHGGGDHAVVMSGKMVGTITMIAGVLAVAYFWTDNDLSGEKIGRYIDQGAVSLSHQAQTTFTRLTDGQSDESTAQEPAPPPPQEG